MLERLASDPFFRELVREVVAYISDPDKWEEEIQAVITSAVPAANRSEFLKFLSRQTMAGDPVSYVDLLNPRSRADLQKIISSSYKNWLSRVKHQQEEAEAPVPRRDPQSYQPRPKEPKSEVTSEPSMEEVQRMVGEEKDLRKFMEQRQKYLKGFGPVERAACVRVVNRFLDSLI